MVIDNASCCGGGTMDGHAPWCRGKPRAANEKPLAWRTIRARVWHRCKESERIIWPGMLCQRAWEPGYDGCFVFRMVPPEPPSLKDVTESLERAMQNYQAFAEAMDAMRKQLNWRGPNDKAMGHVVLPRDQAEVIWRGVAQLAEISRG